MGWEFTASEAPRVLGVGAGQQGASSCDKRKECEMKEVGELGTEKLIWRLFPQFMEQDDLTQQQGK